ncbi:MAG TPA: Rne/Rng family ribonuclease [Verrucomicrobiota bacterium]|jgi:ribonuclease G|nr:MAG: Ribonuclease G [Verrucomicrobia bacterium ADurb.Bin118]HPY30063.1 Rne/Rng family ribonuclease [Verrucomicrobiota bacterium]HQB16568.1 Rne/Rng family ribonuclease [Verrucomicrobiota bacterium]
MSERNFSRRRRGMRFRPAGGLSATPRQKAEAREARAATTRRDVVASEKLFERRHEHEIERAQNIAAGLPPDGVPPAPPGAAPARTAQPADSPAATARMKEKPYQPVPIPEPPPKGIVDTLRSAANKIVQKVQRLLKPTPKTHKEIIINAESLETRVAILEDGKLEEFNIERTTEERLVGSIFKGRVRNLEEGLKAAFVDIGFEKNAFLHYWDIVPNQFDSSVEIVDRGGRKRDKPKITQKDVPRLYPPGSDLIVQVTKGPIGTKGPRVTTNLVLPGRYLVLLPQADQSGISRKIESQQERQRLKKILRELAIPDGMGVIMRTAGEGQQKRYFVRDLAWLLQEWHGITERIKAQPTATCVFQEPDLIDRTVRDFLTEDVERIVVDHPKAEERMRETIARISRRSANKVKFYNDSQPVFDRFGISRQLDNAFARTVHLKSGGYLVVDETEALVAIDVNTGRQKGGKDQEATILLTNLEAAEEIARQLRLRNMGGLIVLDFIDMKSRRDQQSVYQKVKEGLRRDRAKTHVLPISQLGLMEMTRQRHSESVYDAVYDDCPYCKGRGRVKSALSMSVEIQRKLGEILKKRARDESDFQLRIVVHPKVLERLRTQDEKLLIEMEKRYFGKLSFRADPGLHAEQFKILNALNNEELASHGS